MSPKRKLDKPVLVALFVGALLSACGPTPDELAATGVVLTASTATATPTEIPATPLPALTESFQVGEHMAVFLPVGWEGGGDWFGIFSPGDISSLFRGDMDVYQPLLWVFPFSADEFSMGEFGYEEGLNDFAEYLGIVPSDLETLSVGDVSWTRGTFHGSLMELEGTWQGWLAFALPGREGLALAATVPEDEWGEYEDVFETILHGVDFAYQMDAAGHRENGQYFLGQGDFAKAISELDQAIILDPECSRCYNLRGIAFLFSGDSDNALSDFNQAIALNPDCSDCFRNRAMSWDALGNHENAMADFNQAINLAPESASAYSGRGYWYYLHGDLDLALTDLNQAIALLPRWANNYNTRGLVYAALEDFESAIVDYSQAIELDPQNAMFYSNRGDAYTMIEEFNLAIADFSVAIDLNPEEGISYAMRGYLYAQLDEDALAISDLEKAIALGLPPDLETTTEDLLEDLR